MEISQEKTFYLSYSTSHYKIVILVFLLFAAFYAYSYLGVSFLSIVTYIFLIFLGSILVYPFFNIKRPLYILNAKEIRQNKFYFLPRLISWESIKSISYPASPLLGGKDAITLHRGPFQFMTISLADIDKPLGLLMALNHYRPFRLNESEASEYLQRHFDREKLFYTTLLYLCIGISVLLYASFYMPYVILEDNRYSSFWGLLFLLQLFFSLIISFLIYKNIGARRVFLSIVLFLWISVFLGPFIVEKNAYYNMRAMLAEKKGDYAAAERYSRKAIEIYPEGYSYYETLGKAFFGLGEYDKSIMQFNYILKNNKRLTDYYTAHYHLWIGKSCLKINEVDWAREEFQKVKEFNIEEFNREIALLLKDNSL